MIVCIILYICIYIHIYIGNIIAVQIIWIKQSNSQRDQPESSLTLGWLSTENPTFDSQMPRFPHESGWIVIFHEPESSCYRTAIWAWFPDSQTRFQWRHGEVIRSPLGLSDTCARSGPCIWAPTGRSPSCPNGWLATSYTTWYYLVGIFELYNPCAWENYEPTRISWDGTGGLWMVQLRFWHTPWHL